MIPRHVATNSRGKRFHPWTLFRPRAQRVRFLPWGDVVDGSPPASQSDSASWPRPPPPRSRPRSTAGVDSRPSPAPAPLASSNYRRCRYRSAEANGCRADRHIPIGPDTSAVDPHHGVRTRTAGGGARPRCSPAIRGFAALPVSRRWRRPTGCEGLAGNTRAVISVPMMANLTAVRRDLGGGGAIRRPVQQDEAGLGCGRPTAAHGSSD